jgi:hypothetical protein
MAEQAGIDDREGVATEPIVNDDFDDDTAWMDVDLTVDSAISTREKNLLDNMRWMLANVNMQQCDTCHERAFDLAIPRRSNECSRLNPRDTDDWLNFYVNM